MDLFDSWFPQEKASPVFEAETPSPARLLMPPPPPKTVSPMRTLTPQEKLPLEEDEDVDVIDAGLEDSEDEEDEAPVENNIVEPIEPMVLQVPSPPGVDPEPQPEDEEESDDDEAGEEEDFIPPLVSTNASVELPKGMPKPANWDNESAYEKQRLISIWTNQETLKSLGLEDAKDAFKIPKAKRGPRKPKTQEEMIPTRASGRVSKQPVSYNEDKTFTDLMNDKPVKKQRAKKIVQKMESGSDGDTWVGGGSRKRKMKMVENDLETMSQMFPTYWFHIPEAPASGNIGLKISDLPPMLLKALEDHIKALETDEAPDPITSELMYQKVTPQPGGNKGGWQVQMWKTSEGRTIRLGLCDETLMGALMVAAVKLDDRLHDQAQIYSWLYFMAAHQDAAVEYWLAEVGERILDVRHEVVRGGRGTKKVKTQREDEALLSLIGGADDESTMTPAQRREMEKKKRDDEKKQAAARQGIDAAKKRQVPTGPVVPKLPEVGTSSSTSVSLPPLPVGPGAAGPSSLPMPDASGSVNVGDIDWNAVQPPLPSLDWLNDL